MPNINYLTRSNSYICIVDYDSHIILTGYEATRGIIKNFGGSWDSYDGYTLYNDKIPIPNHFNTCIREFLEEIYGFNSKWNINMIKEIQNKNIQEFITSLPEIKVNIQKISDKNIIYDTIYICTKNNLNKLLKLIPSKLHNFLNKYHAFYDQPMTYNDILDRKTMYNTEIRALIKLDISVLVNDIISWVVNELSIIKSIEFKNFFENDTNRSKTYYSLAQIYENTTRKNIISRVEYFINNNNTNTQYNTNDFKKIHAKIPSYFVHDLLAVVELYLYGAITSTNY